MENEEIKKDETETIKAIKEEYEKQIADMIKEHKEEIEKVRKEEEEKKINAIKTLMSGRQYVVEETPIEQEKSFFDLAVEETKNIIGGK